MTIILILEMKKKRKKKNDHGSYHLLGPAENYTDIMD